MRRLAWDQGFVAAPPGRVYPELADPARYPRWWPGVRAERADPGAVGLWIGGMGSVEVRAERHRPSTGLFLRLRGSSAGTMEWFLEEFQDGTIVNSLLDVDLPGGAAQAERRLRRVRVAIRRAMVALKERLE